MVWHAEPRFCGEIGANWQELGGIGYRVEESDPDSLSNTNIKTIVNELGGASGAAKRHCLFVDRPYPR